MPAMKRYLRWLFIPLFPAVMLLWLGNGEASLPSDGPQTVDVTVEDPKLRRTVRLFDMTAALRGGNSRDSINQQGLKIDITMDPSVFELMLVPDNRRRYKDRTTSIAIRFGQGAQKPATVTLRGASTLKGGDRLNFHVRLLGRQYFADDVDLRRFYLTAMIADPWQIRTYFGYRVLTDLNLFPSHFQYARVSVNGEPQGMYLLVEPPTVGIRRQYPGTVAIHRRQKRNIYETYWTASAANPRGTLRRLQQINFHSSVKNPVETYSQVLDLNGYFTWTAVNSVLCNYDSLDELFVYEVRRDKTRPAPLRVMGWDYDEVGSTRQKDGAVPDPLMFSSLDVIDEAIYNHPEIRALYRTTLAQLLQERLTPDYLADTMESVRTLRDQLDDGLPTTMQARQRQDRAVEAARIVETLRARHAELLEHLANSTVLLP